MSVHTVDALSVVGSSVADCDVVSAAVISYSNIVITIVRTTLSSDVSKFTEKVRLQAGLARRYQ